MSRRTRHGRRPAPSSAPLPPSPPDAAPQPLEAAPAAVAVAAVEREPVEPAPAPAVDTLPATPAPSAGPAADGDAARTTCTQAQLRRFIKSRPWVPMHELRRRFGIAGVDDDVTPVRVGAATIFVGLPQVEGRMLGELLSGGEVGYELSLDPGAPIVVGVYPMRPVPRS